MAEVATPLYPKKFCYLNHPWSCAAKMIGGMNNFNDDTAEEILLELLVQWPRVPGQKKDDQEHLESSPLGSLTGIVMFMENTSKGVLGPGGRVAAYIRENSLGDIFETPEVINTGHPDNLERTYRNRAFMWVIDKPAATAWLEAHLTEEVKKEIATKQQELNEYYKKYQYY